MYRNGSMCFRQTDQKRFSDRCRPSIFNCWRLHSRWGGCRKLENVRHGHPQNFCGRKQIVPEKSLFPDRRIAIKYFTDTPAAVNKMHRVFPQSAHVSRTNRTSHILRNKIRLGWSTYPTVPRRSVLTHPALRLQSFLSFLPSLFSRF